MKNKNSKWIWMSALIGFFVGIMFSLLFFIAARISENSTGHIFSAFFNIFYLPAILTLKIFIPCYEMGCTIMYAIFAPPFFYALIGLAIGYLIYLIKQKKNKK